MGRLVDADALSKLVGEPIEVFLRRLDLKLPPTVDAVEVVRCKDCRYYHVYLEGNGHTEKGYGACDWINDKSVREDHFCSWGERREDGKTDLRKGIDEAD